MGVWSTKLKIAEKLLRVLQWFLGQLSVTTDSCSRNRTAQLARVSQKLEEVKTIEVTVPREDGCMFDLCC